MVDCLILFQKFSQWGLIGEERCNFVLELRVFLEAVYGSDLRLLPPDKTKDEVSVHNIRLPKQSTVGDVFNELKTRVELSSPNADIRLLQVFYHKIYKIFPLNEKIENINDQYWTLRAEEVFRISIVLMILIFLYDYFNDISEQVPEEEKNIGPQDWLIHVYHHKECIPEPHGAKLRGALLFGYP